MTKTKRMGHFPRLDLLRNVVLGDTGYRLAVWDTERNASTGQLLLAYVLSSPDGTVIFKGDDFGCSPMHAIDSDESLRALLGFLTLRPGDTDEEYFANYTRRQRAFAQDEAEALQMWAEEEYADDYPLVDVD